MIRVKRVHRVEKMPGLPGLNIDLIKVFHCLHGIELLKISDASEDQYQAVSSDLCFDDLSCLDSLETEDGQAIAAIFSEDGKEDGCSYLREVFWSVPIIGVVSIFHNRNDNGVWRRQTLDSPTYRDITSALENLGLCYYGGDVRIEGGNIFVDEDIEEDLEEDSEDLVHPDLKDPYEQVDDELEEWRIPRTVSPSDHDSQEDPTAGIISEDSPDEDERQN